MVIVSDASGKPVVRNPPGSREALAKTSAGTGFMASFQEIFLNNL